MSNQEDKDLRNNIWPSTLTFHLNLFGKEVLIKRYGGNFCFWDKIKFFDDKKEFYKITKKDETRTEFFSGKKFRIYENDKFCFVEYCDYIHKYKRFPKQVYLIKKGLEDKIAHGYEKIIRKIIKK